MMVFTLTEGIPVFSEIDLTRESRVFFEPAILYAKNLSKILIFGTKSKLMDLNGLILFLLLYVANHGFVFDWPIVEQNGKKDETGCGSVFPCALPVNERPKNLPLL